MKRIIGICLVIVIIIAVFTPVLEAKSNDVKFTDINNHWAESSIVQAAQLGLVNGVGNNLFQPNSSVNRESFIALLIRSLGNEKLDKINLQEYTPFIDVPDTRWSSKIIKQATSLGWINQSDYQNYLFEPTKVLTREEAASFLAAMMFDSNDKSDYLNDSITFSDISTASSNYRDDILFLASIGVLQGNNGKFNPKQPLTRAESTTFVMRALSYQLNTLAYFANIDGQYRLAKSYAFAAYNLSSNTISLSIIGLTYYAEEEYELSEEILLDAINEGHENPFLYMSLALSAFQQKNYKDAISYQSEVVRIIPEDPLQNFLLAQYYSANLQFADALEFAKHAKKYDEGHVYLEEIDNFILNINEVNNSNVSYLVPVSFVALNNVLKLSNIFKNVSDFIDENKDFLSMVSIAMAPIPGVYGTINAIIVINSVARVYAAEEEDKGEAITELLWDATSALGFKGGKMISKAVSNANESRIFMSRVVSESAHSMDHKTLKYFNNEINHKAYMYKVGSEIRRDINVLDKLSDISTYSGDYYSVINRVLVDNEPEIIYNKPPFSDTSIIDQNKSLIQLAKDNYIMKFMMKDSDSNELFDVYLFAESKPKIENAVSWACASEGEKLYSGDFSLAISSKSTGQEKVLDVGYKEFNLNRDIYIVEGDPDLFTISTCWASSYNSVNIWYIYKGELKHVQTKDGDVNFSLFGKGIKSIGKSKYQMIEYYRDSEDLSWTFDKWELNTKSGVMHIYENVKYSAKEFNKGKLQADNFFKSKSYIAK